MARMIYGMPPTEASEVLSGGDTRSKWVCVELFRLAPLVDPDSLMEGWGPLSVLNDLEIFDERIFQLYHACGGYVGLVIAVLRAWQAGVQGISKEVIDHAIENRGEGLDFQAIVEGVRAEAPNFNQGNL